MSSFGAIAIDARTMPFDALIAASGKCIEGPPGHGVRHRPPRVLEQCAGNSTSLSLDLHDQWQYMEKTTQWRYTPPTHVVVGVRRRRSRRSSPKAGSRRGSPATRATTRRWCAAWPSSASGRSSIRESRRRSSSRSTRRADPRYTFRAFYDSVRDKGFILYPGKLTQVETFRVGCIGAIGRDEMRHAVNAVRDTLAELGIDRVAPVAAKRVRRLTARAQGR